MISKLIVIAVMLIIVYSLGSGLYFLVRDDSDKSRTVKALSWRIGLSFALFIFLFVGFAFGFINPHGIG